MEAGRETDSYPQHRHTHVCADMGIDEGAISTPQREPIVAEEISAGPRMQRSGEGPTDRGAGRAYALPQRVRVMFLVGEDELLRAKMNREDARAL